jgi:alpha-L-rhamnosidase
MNPDSPAHFPSAQPVWIADLEREKNITAGFCADVHWDGKAGVALRVAASSLYRATVNGHFAGYGPARAPHGYLRVDEWGIGRLLVPGANRIAIEVVGYNLNSFYQLDQPSCLQAEVVAGDGSTLAATADRGAPFIARVLPGRVRKVQRLSPQRCFAEVYRLTPDYDQWRVAADASRPAKLSVQPTWKLLPRRVPLPRFKKVSPLRCVAQGKVTRGARPQEHWRPWNEEGFERHGGWHEAELEEKLSDFIQTLAFIKQEPRERSLLANSQTTIGADGFTMLDFGANYTGFIHLHFRCENPVRLLLRFDEVLTDGDIKRFREGNINAVCYDLEAGDYELETIEPYTLRYLKLIVLGGPGQVNCFLREYANDDVWDAAFQCDDERINSIFAAARQTYRQNALDTFMDCPSRERGGYLADSFFAARAEAIFSGASTIESNFFENYSLPDTFAPLPTGMIPMCYPADHPRARFIPNWALWFILQLEEYSARSGGQEVVDALASRVRGILEYLQRFENEHELLESLPGWVFVDWSRANEFVEDVSFATNMLYAAALSAATRLYGCEAWEEKSIRIREAIRSLSYNGRFFADHALHLNGRLQVAPNCTEACQYYAFYFDIATPQSHPTLWLTLRDEFGPQRSATGAYPEIHPSNAFLGMLLRFEVLSRYAEVQRLTQEIPLYLSHMAETTGTLWEYFDARASCNHGFQAHIAHVLFRDLLGLHAIDRPNREVTVRFTDAPLRSCRGRTMTGAGPIELEWRKTENRLLYRLAVPDGYQVTVENETGLKLCPWERSTSCKQTL